MPTAKSFTRILAPLELRRTILANLPSDYIGFKQYWRGRSAQKQPVLFRNLEIL